MYIVQMNYANKICLNRTSALHRELPHQGLSMCEILSK